jgi:hypothetical protein
MNTQTSNTVDLRPFLDEYTELWIQSMPGAGNQIDRRNALAKAKENVSKLPENLAALMAELTRRSVDILNHRDHYEDYTRLQLEAQAILTHIVIEDKEAITVIESSLAKCKEIQRLLKGNRVA